MVPRLFVDDGLADGAPIELALAQSHYLRDVMRLGVGASVTLFNGRDGEWAAVVDAVAKRSVTLRATARKRPQTAEPDLWLCFAPVKKARIDFIAEKATELGASALRPVLTRHTMVERVNVERLRANAVEAAEQTGRLTVPVVEEPVTLAAMLATWPAGRRLMICDETGGGAPVAQALASLDETGRAAPWAVLIGPEGGFAREELDRISAVPGVLPVGLGPRILRADTAVVAALACWQAMVGDWRAATPRLSPDYATNRNFGDDTRGNLIRGMREEG